MTLLKASSPTGRLRLDRACLSKVLSCMWETGARPPLYVIFMRKETGIRLASLHVERSRREKMGQENGRGVRKLVRVDQLRTEHHRMLDSTLLGTPTGIWLDFRLWAS
jgi:hypothetical protein